jgi:hypothetical protein
LYPTGHKGSAGDWSRKPAAVAPAAQHTSHIPLVLLLLLLLLLPD